MQYMCESECTPLISNGQTILFFKREVGVKIYTRKLKSIRSAARMNDTQKVLKSSQKKPTAKKVIHILFQLLHKKI